MDSQQPLLTVPELNSQPQKNRWKKTVDVRWLAFVLVLLLTLIVFFIAKQGGLLGMSAKDRQIRVTGEASVTDTPDEFAFYPSYTVRNNDRNAALKEVASKSTTVTAGLKALGVTDSQIKSSANGFSKAVDTGAIEPSRGSTDSNASSPAIAPAPDRPTGDSYGLQFTVIVKDKDLAQKIQDYLNTTGSDGIATPISSFSDNKRKELESKARDAATKDARAKADQSAKNLGFKVGAVKAVTDGNGFNDNPIARPAVLDAEKSDTTASDLQVQPGSQSLRYTVTVEYYLR